MNKEYLKSLIDEVSAIEVKSEAQQIAKYELIEYAEELQDRINKAIEYLENNIKFCDERGYDTLLQDKILEALKGGIK